MAGISMNNGQSFIEPMEAIKRADWQTIVNMMDDETRETVHAEMAPCTELEFLTRYLELAQADLIIG